MKKTGKITICAMMAALASALMLTSYFPYLTYAIPAVAGLFMMVVVIETDIKWATVTYIASAIIVFIMAEPEAKMLYVLFFGYYPIVKSLLERLRSRVAEYLLKFLVFNASVIVAYLLMSELLGISINEMGGFGKYTALVMLAAGNIVFPIYDIAVAQVARFYIVRVHPAVAKTFKF